MILWLILNGSELAIRKELLGLRLRKHFGPMSDNREKRWHFCLSVIVKGTKHKMANIRMSLCSDVWWAYIWNGEYRFGCYISEIEEVLEKVMIKDLERFSLWGKSEKSFRLFNLEAKKDDKGEKIMHSLEKMNRENIFSLLSHPMKLRNHNFRTEYLFM